MSTRVSAVRDEIKRLKEAIESEKDPKKKTKLEEKLHAVNPTE